MLISKNDLQHIIDVIKADLEATVDANSLKAGDMCNATEETIAYCERSKRILERFTSQSSESLRTENE